jgi:hypothetical protein
MRRNFILILMGLSMVVVLGVVLLLILVLAARDSETSSNTAPASTSITVGVILSDPAVTYGWGDVTVGGDYAEAQINGHRVIVLDNVNAAARPGLTLEQVVSTMVENGARYFFLAPRDFGEDATERIAQRYDDRVFILNLSTRRDVERLLDTLSATQADPRRLAAQPETVPEPASASDTTTTDSQRTNGGVVILSVLVLGTIVIGAALTQWWKNISVRSSGKTKRGRAGAGVHARGLALEQAAKERATDFAAEGLPAPLVREFSTYVNGDRHFDESFSIELPDGAFLGECGVSIAAKVNRYHPDYPTAFEVWMFDKNDIRTVNAIIASEHATRDRHLREKLDGKGQFVQAEPDVVTRLETKTLTLRARLLEMQYGFSDTLPQRSFFEHIVLEIAVWQKPA